MREEGEAKVSVQSGQECGRRGLAAAAMAAADLVERGDVMLWVAFGADLLVTRP